MAAERIHRLMPTASESSSWDSICEFPNKGLQKDREVTMVCNVDAVTETKRGLGD